MWGGGASPTQIREEAETETKALRDTRKRVNRVRGQARKRLDTGAGTGGHTENPGKGKGGTRGRRGRATVLRNPAQGDPGVSRHLQLRLPGLSPALWFSFRVD